MSKGNTGLPAAAVCLWLVISGALSQTSSTVEEDEAPCESYIRQSYSMCDGEREYINMRKQIVVEALSNLGIDCDEETIPRIAFLASGGGQRAAVGLVGSLYQLKKANLLDTVLYLGGVSGSTWSMATLYGDPEWSNRMDDAVRRLSSPGVELKQALDWLTERRNDNIFSLSDIWGVLTSAGIMKQLDTRHLSDESCRNATNPYPIYCAVEKECLHSGPTEGKWFEVSPHEAGFPELGRFIETSLLGSKFQGGEMVEKMPEMDMVRLQGVLGCALAHGETIRSHSPSWLNITEYLDTASKYVHMYNTLQYLIALTRSTINNPNSVDAIEKLQKILEEKVGENKAEYLKAMTTEEKARLVQQWTYDMLPLLETWCHSLEEGSFKKHMTFLIEQLLPLIVKWEWGTTQNFLYQYEDSSIPACLSGERLHLLDAGLLVNVAYPSFLGDKRDIDLIIAPEYSAGKMFETLTMGRDYAAEFKKPFPKVDDEILKDRDWPKDCYVFEGKEREPTIIFMPLFNRNNSKDAADIKAKMNDFTTFQPPFTQEKLEYLLETAKANVKNNQDTLLNEIKKAFRRRLSKQGQ
ncbi:cytosolic phospholipase A2 zeta-like [Mugil cephalus]|uniref:cytosolic phospholipase A2 zeta-like n=1 Tax=Mugil cephalus TaxID=48193 RepID=UPI001FB63FF4|nr:cytosolic phospholipase A2 zeta-like [Mugil cephalus]